MKLKRFLCAAVVFALLISSWTFTVNVRTHADAVLPNIIMTPGASELMSNPYNTFVNDMTTYGKIQLRPNRTQPIQSFFVYENSSYFESIDNCLSQYGDAYAVQPIIMNGEDDIERSIVYNVREQTYFAFNVISGCNYKVSTLRNLLLDEKGTGWQLHISYDNGKTFEKAPKYDVFNAKTVKWPDNLTMYNFNPLEFIETNKSTPDLYIDPVNEAGYSVICMQYYIPKYATNAKIVFPSINAISDNKDRNGPWAQLLSSVKTSRVPVVLSGDIPGYIYGTANRANYTDPAYSINENAKSFLSIITTKEDDITVGKIFNDQTSPNNKDMTLAALAAGFKLDFSEIVFYENVGGQKTKITDLTRKVKSEMIIEFVVADIKSNTYRVENRGGVYYLAGLKNGDIISDYEIIVGEYKEPVFSLKDTVSNITLDVSTVKNRRMTITLNIEDEYPSYNDIANSIDCQYGEVLFSDAVSGLPITDLTQSAVPDTVVDFVTKNCPGQPDGIIKESYKISIVIEPQYLNPPQYFGHERLVLKPGIVDRVVMSYDKNDASQAFSKYGSYDDPSLSGYTNPGGGKYPNYGWLGDAYYVFGAPVDNHYCYGSDVTKDKALGVDYRVVPETHVGAVFLFNGEIPADALLKAIDSVKFLVSDDKLTWTPLSNIYKGTFKEGTSLGLASKDLREILMERDNGGKGQNNVPGAFAQVLFSAEIPQGKTYLKVVMPNSSYINEHDGMRRFKNKTTGELDMNVKYTYSATYGWNSGETQQGTVAPHTKLADGDGRLVSKSSDGPIWTGGALLAAVKASSVPITTEDYGDYEYVNDYDSSEAKSNDLFALELNDKEQKAVLRLERGETKPLHDVEALLSTQLCEVAFYTDSTKSQKINDLSVLASDGIFIEITAQNNKAVVYFPNGKVIGQYTIETFVLTVLPEIYSDSADIYIDHSERTLTFTHYLDVDPVYDDVLKLIKTKYANISFKTFSNDALASDLLITPQTAKLVVAAKDCPGFSNGTVVSEYALITKTVLKKFAVTVVDSSVCKISENEITILKPGTTIEMLLKALRFENATYEFSMATEAGDFLKLTSFSTVIDENVYMDVFSTIDARTTSFSFILSSKNEEQKPLPSPEKPKNNDDSPKRPEIDNVPEADDSALTEKENKLKALFITRLSERVPGTVSETDIMACLQLIVKYEELTIEQKRLVPDEIREKMQNIKIQISTIVHTNNSVTVEGIPWNIKVLAFYKNEKDEIVSEIRGSIENSHLLMLCDIKLYDIITNEEYQIPKESTVKVTMPKPKTDTALENECVIHKTHSGEIEYLKILEDKNGFVTFRTASLSLVGIIGDTTANLFPFIIGGATALVLLSAGAVFVFLKVKKKRLTSQM